MYGHNPSFRVVNWLHVGFSEIAWVYSRIIRSTISLIIRGSIIIGSSFNGDYTSMIVFFPQLIRGPLDIVIKFWCRALVYDWWLPHRIFHGEDFFAFHENAFWCIQGKCFVIMGLMARSLVVSRFKIVTPCSRHPTWISTSYNWTSCLTCVIWLFGSTNSPLNAIVSIVPIGSYKFVVLVFFNSNMYLIIDSSTQA